MLFPPRLRPSLSLTLLTTTTNRVVVGWETKTKAYATQPRAKKKPQNPLMSGRCSPCRVVDLSSVHGIAQRSQQQPHPSICSPEARFLSDKEFYIGGRLSVPRKVAANSYITLGSSSRNDRAGLNSSRITRRVLTKHAPAHAKRQQQRKRDADDWEATATYQLHGDEDIESNDESTPGIAPSSGDPNHCCLLEIQTTMTNHRQP